MGQRLGWGGGGSEYGFGGWRILGCVQKPYVEFCSGGVLFRRSKKSRPLLGVWEESQPPRNLSLGYGLKVEYRPGRSPILKLVGVRLLSGGGGASSLFWLCFRESKEIA